MHFDTNSISILGIFLYGCTASVHCIGMCGGIIMSVTVDEKEGKISIWKKQAAYHLGRLLMGVIWGIFLGITGKIIVWNPYFKFLFPAVCGMIMIYMGIVHLGVIDKISVPVMQTVLARMNGKIKKKGSLLAGVLTGMLPCGMLSTVQVYAAGTGSIAEACASMLAFIAGTIPILVLFGTFHGMITGVARRITVKISGIITILLGVELISKAVPMLK